VLLVGAEINGARRWLHLAGYSFQPSELAKPAFVVISAWLLAKWQRRPGLLALPLALGLYLTLVGLLALQPDVGQAMLVSVVWCTLFFLAGGRLTWFVGLIGMVAAGFWTAYASIGYVRFRVDRFLSPGLGESYQAARARQSFVEGGLFGRGPGEGTIKAVLPDAHNDFIFAVIAEEYGALACLVVLGLFALVVARVFARQMREGDDFLRLAAMGLALLFGLQAIINMAVNTGLLPTKGMTLPLISIGGSSTLAVGVGLGMLLALTRRRADLAHMRPPFLPMPARAEPA
jgi:cell division protein FtsW